MITIIIITINRQKDIKTYLVTSLVSCFLKIIKKSNFPLLNIKETRDLILDQNRKFLLIKPKVRQTYISFAEGKVLHLMIRKPMPLFM